MYCLVDFCCICFRNKEHLHRLFETNDDNITYFIKLTTSVPEMLFNTITDQRLVCKTCCETLDAVYMFRQKCLRSKTTLTDYVSQLHQFSRISGAVNVHLIDINKFDVIKTVQSENNMENLTEKTELLKTFNKDSNLKVHSESYFQTEIKSEPNQINLKVGEIGQNYMNMENVLIKMEIEDLNSEEHVEESIDDPLDNQDDISVNLSRNDIELTVSEIKKESENQDIEEYLHESFNSFEICNSLNDTRTALEENSDYVVKCSNDSLMNLNEIKIEVVNNDIKLIDGEINTERKNEHIVKISKERVIPLQDQEADKTNTDGSLFHNFKLPTMEENQMETSPNKIPNLQGGKVNSRECSICQKKFTNPSHLTCHMRIHTGEKPYECQICKKKFSSSSNLSSHRRIHSEEKPYECTICKNKYRSLSYLTYHLRMHTGEKPFECDICKKTFLQPNELTKHKRIHTGEKPHECDVCKKKFRQTSGLTKHMVIHVGGKSFECDVCKWKFRDSSNLNNHKLIHTGEKPYECDVCKQKFLRRSSLNKHMLIHTGEKPYECNVCKTMFRDLSSLYRHMRHHTGEKPYKCDVCKRMFRLSSTLSKHMLIHNREKPHKCSVCNKKFPTSDHLTKHMLIHNEEKTM